MASLPHAFSPTNTVLILITSSIIYIVTRTIYRLYFHPLAHFVSPSIPSPSLSTLINPQPGPKLAATTFLYEAYHDVFLPPGGQFATHLTQLHKTYGSIIRCSPDEMSVPPPHPKQIS